MPKIMIDAGHTGKYNRSPAVLDYFESDFAWKFHLLLKKELESYGFVVGTTRASQDEFLDVYYRGAKAKGYDMFLSIHTNAVGGGVNDSIDHPVIIRQATDTKSQAFCERLSQKIADLMHTKEKGKVSTRLQGNGAEWYGVLRGAKANGCNRAYIVEHSFHTATVPTRWLLNANNLKLLAEEEAKLIANEYGLKKKEEEILDMTKEELVKLINDSIPKEKVYHWFKELPSWAKKPIFILWKSGIFSGASSSDLNLTMPEIRTLCWIYRITPNDKLVKVTDEDIKKYTN